MKILSLEVENILGCRHAELDLTGRSLHIIGGRNYQGKSSFLTGLAMVLGGKRLFPLSPITDGEDEAKIVLRIEPCEADTGIPWPCTVTRILSRDEENPTTYSTKVEIRPTDDEDSTPAQTPQKLLDELVSDGLAFDPLKFVQASATAQADILRALVGIDFAKIDSDREKLYNRRAKVNTEVKIVDGQIKGLELPDNVPTDRVDVGQLTTRLKAAHDHNAELLQAQDSIGRYQDDIAAADKQMDLLHNQLESLQQQRERMVESAEKLKSNLENSETQDTTDIEEQIEQAAGINRIIDLQEQALTLREQRSTRRKDADKLTKELKAIDKRKRDMASEAEWPVEGLGFGPTGVTLNDTPFSSLSSAEQLRCAVAIQLRKNPQFPVAVIRDGSLLDGDSMMELTKTVAELGGQCFVERVGPDDCHLVFENGIGSESD